MGYVTLTFPCANCGRPGMANPDLVLSIPAVWDSDRRGWVPDRNGFRQPVCRSCAALALERIRSGDPTLSTVAPRLREPGYLERAYDQPADEDEVDW